MLKTETATTVGTETTSNFDDARGQATRAAGDLAQVFAAHFASTSSNDLQAAQIRKPTTNAVPEAIISSWGKIAKASMSEALYGNLVRIALSPDDWRGPGSSALRAESLQSFLEFWSTAKNSAVEPELSLAPDGSLYAEWFKSMRQRLDVKFTDQKVAFGLFANNGIIEGADKVGTVAHLLISHPAKPLRWNHNE